MVVITKIVIAQELPTEKGAKNLHAKSQINHFRLHSSPIPIKGLSHRVIYVQPERAAKTKLPSSSATIIISIYSRHSRPL